jgi:DNA-binding response OmpR family regulator
MQTNNCLFYREVAMSKGKILVVDDEPEIVRSISMRLKMHGYEVIAAADGTQATSTALRELPDLILLDIGLPAGSGHIVAKRLRDSTKTAQIPIIFLTARTTESDYQQAFELGVEQYITKPFRPEELMFAIEATLRSPEAGTLQAD